MYNQHVLDWLDNSLDKAWEEFERSERAENPESMGMYQRLITFINDKIEAEEICGR